MNYTPNFLTCAYGILFSYVCEAIGRKEQDWSWARTLEDIEMIPVVTSVPNN